MEQIYPFTTIEKKWQTIWQNLEIFKSKPLESKEKYYVLEMLPYPSGKIHMGHVRNYTIGDVIARFLRLNGKNIFHPIGWDAFGLPAENAAIEKGVNPAEWTYNNIKEMREQLKSLGLSYDWETEIATCDPSYYKWTQWLFLQFYKKNLVEKRDGKVNFCPTCNTVLANEQVINGLCWRCNSVIEQKNLSQWYLKITDYAEKLLENHEELKNHWPDRVLNMQKNWIGKSAGAEIDFQVLGYEKKITVFTTRPDTLFGVTYLALASEHPFIMDILSISASHEEIERFVEKMKNLSTAQKEAMTEKEGIFTGFFAIHPLTGNSIPIYTANFVLMNYGKGAVMGVSAHDERDFEFAKKYNLPLQLVIQNPENSLDENNMSQPYTEHGRLVHSQHFNGLTTDEAKKAIVQELEKKGKGKEVIYYKLRDWLISRQRYWGTPIPIVYCKHCGTVPVKESDLPITLPTDIEFKVGQNPLNTSQSFIHTTCPNCNSPATRETDTMDTFVDSSWYFARYTSAKDNSQALNPKESFYWLPVDQYIGGIEHAVMHLLYARFFNILLKEIGLVPTEEPFKRLITQGMVVSPSYYCNDCKTYYAPEEIKNETCPKGHKNILIKMDKMSKSKKNGVDPKDLMESYGVDASRLFSLFAAPIERDLEWNENGVVGSFKFLKRFYTLCSHYSPILKNSQKNFDFNALSPKNQNLVRNFHKAIQKVTFDIQNNYQFNTAIACLMEYFNELFAYKLETEADYAPLKHILVHFNLLLFPFAPHIAEECYSMIDGEAKTLHYLSFPSFNPLWTEDLEVHYAIQVNGKNKGILKLPKGLAVKDVLENATSSLPSFSSAIKDKLILKEIFVPDKILNLVVKDL